MIQQFRTGNWILSSIYSDIDRDRLIRCASLVCIEMQRFLNHVITGKESKVLCYLSPHPAVFHMHDKQYVLLSFTLALVLALNRARASNTTAKWWAYVFIERNRNGQQQPHHLLNHHLSVAMHAKCTAFFALDWTKQQTRTIQTRERVRPSTRVSINCAVWKMHT